MLIREGRARSIAHDRRLACALALVAGSLNSAGFSAVGVFSANMTGNVTTLADRVALGDVLTGAFYLAVVAAFVLGAASLTLFTAIGKRNGIERVYAVAVMVEAVLLAGLGTADLALSAAARGAVLVFGLAFLMGAQNAIVTLISDARVRTTHVSGMATDVGIEIGRLADIALRRSAIDEAQPFRDKLGLHGLTIAAFCSGGVLGVVAYRAWGAWFLFGAAAMLSCFALPALLLRRDPEAAGPIA